MIVGSSASLNLTTGVTIGTSGNLTVNGALNVPTLTTTGMTDLSGATGTIGTLDVDGGTTTLASPTITQVNANGGVLNTAGGGIANLTVAGGTVNTTAPTTVSTHLQVDSGQLNLTGGNLSVPTATIGGGAVNASAGALVVSDTATLGELTISTSGPAFELSGANVPDHSTARTLTVNGGTVTMTAGTPPATPITVLNHSFESPDLVDAMDTGDVPDWDEVEVGIPHGIATDARLVTTGPSDGDQALVLGDRSIWGGPGTNAVSQQIGVGSDFSAYDELVMTFDARKGDINDYGTGDDPDNTVEAYFMVGGTKVSAGQFISDCGPYNGGSSLLRNIDDIPSGNMDTFTATLDVTSGVDPTDTIEIAISYDSPDNGSGGDQPRMYFDNIRVASGGGPIPEEIDLSNTTIAATATTTLALPGVTGAVTLAGIEVDDVATLTINDAAVVSVPDGPVTVDGTLGVAGDLQVGGILSGSGTISTGGSIVISGILSPGDDGVGTLTLGNGEIALVSTHDAKVVVPEPGTLAMLLGGLAGLVVPGRRRRT